MILMRINDKAYWVGNDLFSYRFTESNIVLFVRDAPMEPIRTVQKATHKKVRVFFLNISASVNILTIN